MVMSISTETDAGSHIHMQYIRPRTQRGEALRRAKQVNKPWFMSGSWAVSTNRPDLRRGDRWVVYLR